ncbi:MAG: hypothetical protein IID32_04025, partial [Planctomycetes bacterium]|nr:hypothetical protein [Planctomycetota bacterium]
MYRKIRKAEAGDVMFIQDIVRNTIRTQHRSYLGIEGLNDSIDGGASHQYFYENIEKCDVLLLSDAIIGFIIYKGNLIDLMMISDGFHRQGYGSQLLIEKHKLISAAGRFGLFGFGVV